MAEFVVFVRRQAVSGASRRPRERRRAVVVVGYGDPCGRAAASRRRDAGAAMVMGFAAVEVGRGDSDEEALMVMAPAVTRRVAATSISPLLHTDEGCAKRAIGVCHRGKLLQAPWGGCYRGGVCYNQRRSLLPAASAVATSTISGCYRGDGACYKLSAMLRPRRCYHRPVALLRPAGRDATKGWWYCYQPPPQLLRPTVPPPSVLRAGSEAPVTGGLTKERWSLLPMAVAAAAKEGRCCCQGRPRLLTAVVVAAAKEGRHRCRRWSAGRRCCQGRAALLPAVVAEGWRCYLCGGHRFCEQKVPAHHGNLLPTSSPAAVVANGRSAPRCVAGLLSVAQGVVISVETMRDFSYILFCKI